MAFKKKIERRETELISLADVIFLLLIFFLVSTTLAHKTTLIQELLNVSLPNHSENQLQRSISTAKKRESAHLLIQAFMDNGEVKFYLLHECLTPTRMSRPISKTYANIDPDIWPQVPWLNLRSEDNPDPRYYLGSAKQLKQPVNYEVVQKRIISIKKLLNNPRIIIRAEVDLRFESIADLLGLCNQQGISQVILTTDGLENLDDFARGK